MSDNAYASDQITEPSDAMVALDRLVGTWTVTGGAEGTVRYEWMPGRFLLLQYVDLTQYGPDDRPGGDRPSPSVREPPVKRFGPVTTTQTAIPWTTSTS
jgi:hypothetical protein